MGLAEEEDLEMQALLRVGARRRNRWFNDRLLRELAGPMDASDMKAQFAPPPFGVPADPSQFEYAMMSGQRDILVNMNMDDEMAMCQQWEELQATKGASRRTEPEDVFKRAITGWSRVASRARPALRRGAGLPVVKFLDDQILNFMEDDNTSQEHLLLTLPDSFQRMLVHGICDFYGLTCFSVTKDDGIRITKVHKCCDSLRQIQMDKCQLSCSNFLKLLSLPRDSDQ